MKVIELHKSVTASNDADAQALRDKLRAEGRLLVNIMSAAGSGKTTLLSRIITDLREKARIAVIEADIDASVDAERIEALGARSIQAHTDGMCHMDAGMTAQAIAELGQDDTNLLFLENVGNLICPAEDDKPLKYPLMFRNSDALVITKTDALPYFNFDMDKCMERARALNPAIRIFPVSAKSGQGMQALETWILQKMNREV